MSFKQTFSHRIAEQLFYKAETLQKISKAKQRIKGR